MDDSDCCQHKDPSNVEIKCAGGLRGDHCAVLIDRNLLQKELVTGTHHTEKVTAHTTAKAEGTHHTTAAASHTTKKA